MITNATVEISFSGLKHIKNLRRLAMTQERLNRLAIMAIDNDVLNNLQFTDVLEKFVTKKLRKANI